jgi:hypothetical protein
VIESSGQWCVLRAIRFGPFNRAGNAPRVDLANHIERVGRCPRGLTMIRDFPPRQVSLNRMFSNAN